MTDANSIDRRDFHKSWLAGCALLAAGTRPASAKDPAAVPQPTFDLRGVYFHDGFHVDPQRLAPLYWDESDWRRQIRWLEACGLNAVEFATMLEFNRKPSTQLEHDKISDRLRILELAHQLGLQFGYILTNTVVSTVPENEPPGDQLQNRAVQLCPRVQGNFEKTIQLQAWYMDTYREADFFEEFAADWGACFCGQCDVNQYLRYVRELSAQLSGLNPSALLYANTWCVSYWGPNPIPQGWRHVYEQETIGSRKVIDAIPTMPTNVHLALPCHNLYRALAYSSFGSKQQTPEFPARLDLQPLYDAGRKVLGWPHFVMDDDPSRDLQWGVVHSEVRYIQSMLERLRSAGIDRVMGNLYLPTLQLVNTYALGRLATSLDVELLAVLLDFARLIAHPADIHALHEVLCWLDNHSYWNEQLPDDARLSEFACTLSRETAARLLSTVRPCPQPELPLPVSPRTWLDDLARSVPRMTWTT